MAGSEHFRDGKTLEDHSAFSFHTIRYQFDDGTSAEVIQTPAWCYDCNRVVSAEHIESEEEKQKERKQFDDFVSGRPSSNPLADLVYSNMPSDYLTIREQHWSRFENRQQPATCLECHGWDIFNLVCSKDSPTEVPNGPTLWHTGSAIADVWPIPIVRIDINGKLISRTTSE